MRFNKSEVTALARQPSHKFEKEGVLFVKEKQEGFFRRSESMTTIQLIHEADHNVPAGSDHHFQTVVRPSLRPSVRPKTSKLSDDHCRTRLWAGRVDHWWLLSCRAYIEMIAETLNLRFFSSSWFFSVLWTTYVKMVACKKSTKKLINPLLKPVSCKITENPANLKVLIDD